MEEKRNFSLVYGTICKQTNKNNDLKIVRRKAYFQMGRKCLEGDFWLHIFVGKKEEETVKKHTKQ